MTLVDGSSETPLSTFCYGSGGTRRNVYSSAVFTGCRPPCS